MFPTTEQKTEISESWIFHLNKHEKIVKFFLGGHSKSLPFENFKIFKAEKKFEKST
jgi:hypothetical protein